MENVKFKNKWKFQNLYKEIAPSFFVKFSFFSCTEELLSLWKFV